MHLSTSSIHVVARVKMACDRQRFEPAALFTFSRVRRPSSRWSGTSRADPPRPNRLTSATLVVAVEIDLLEPVRILEVLECLRPVDEAGIPAGLANRLPHARIRQAACRRAGSACARPYYELVLHAVGARLATRSTLLASAGAAHRADRRSRSSRGKPSQHASAVLEETAPRQAILRRILVGQRVHARFTLLLLLGLRDGRIRRWRPPASAQVSPCRRQPGRQEPAMFLVAQHAHGGPRGSWGSKGSDGASTDATRSAAAGLARRLPHPLSMSVAPYFDFGVAATPGT